jgi:dTDP-4-dehydrorhamnose 3,5-epimerase-like enzyme
MADVKVIAGEIFQDQRGQISSLNNFRFTDVKRVYLIHHPDINVVRGWNGHQFEKKWFYCIKGSFTLGLVEIDNWEQPSPDLKAKLYALSEDKSQIVCVPAGYANCIKARSPNSVLMVFSSILFNEAAADSWRYDSSLWVDWSEK